MAIIKHADDEMALKAAELVDLKAAKKSIDDRIKETEKILKDGMEERSSTEAVFGANTVSYIKVAESRTVDTDRLKADGLYDRYSKPKAGYTQVKVSPYKPAGAF